MVPTELGTIVRAAMDEALQERGHVNVLIAGRTGVGKSTLINAVFQGRYAETGQGRPVTPDTREITRDGVPLTIFDTRGLEMAEYRDTVVELEKLVRTRSRETDPNRHIHVAWVCIQEPGRRVEDAEIALHEMLARHMPVIAVITKATSDGGFRAEVQRLLPHAAQVVRVRAIEEQLDDGHRLPTLGLSDLVTLTLECVPEGHRRAFTAAQKACLEIKVKRSRAMVGAASVAAAATGATPIPFADAAVLVPLQVSMIAGISATFGLSLDAALLSTLVTSASGTTAATFAGRTLVANLLKLVPGAGTLAGAAISGATAAALTAALGESYIRTLAALFAETGGEPPTAADVSARFAATLHGRQA